MKAIVGADEWYPMAEIELETSEYYKRVTATKGCGYKIIDVTSKEVMEYKDLCKRVEEMSSMFLCRDGVKV
jgi:hypothetical protein